jgi:hypothetical protein
MRAALVRELERAADRLHADSRLAVLGALAVLPEIREMRTYQERRDWLAVRLARDARTADRRIKAATQLLAEEVAAELMARRTAAAAAIGGWYLSLLDATLLIDEETEAIERRRIVATSAGLQEITVAFELPSRPGPHQEVKHEILHGGTLLAAEETRSRNRSRLVIRFPAPLQAGEAHEYTVRMRVSASLSTELRPYYLVTPERRCDAFDLKAHFGPTRVPAWARRIDGETRQMTEDAVPSEANMVAIDNAGDISLSFRNLQKYLSYGVEWAPGLFGGHASELSP